jgi:hypothetical protein
MMVSYRVSKDFANLISDAFRPVCTHFLSLLDSPEEEVSL